MAGRPPRTAGRRRRTWRRRRTSRRRTNPTRTRPTPCPPPHTRDTGMTRPGTGRPPRHPPTAHRRRTAPPLRNLITPPPRRSSMGTPPRRTRTSSSLPRPTRRHGQCTLARHRGCRRSLCLDSRPAHARPRPRLPCSPRGTDPTRETGRWRTAATLQACRRAWPPSCKATCPRSSPPCLRISKPGCSTERRRRRRRCRSSTSRWREQARSAPCGHRRPLWVAPGLRSSGGRCAARCRIWALHPPKGFHPWVMLPSKLWRSAELGIQFYEEHHVEVPACRPALGRTTPRGKRRTDAMPSCSLCGRGTAKPSML
mmetsp:Transcript_30573/g.98870  ORF Transcript_30573/g.98870 Transcript_30573/m.98870 type:complete len:312 (-) Transcript_30573:491-1426(-)